MIPNSLLQRWQLGADAACSVRGATVLSSGKARLAAILRKRGKGRSSQAGADEARGEYVQWMAAFTRTLLPQVFVQSLPSLARAFAPSKAHKWAIRNLAVTSRLQPTFPDKPDELLYETSSDEYQVEAPNVLHFTASYPCDALATAARERNLQLATRLLEEYKAANVNIIHRTEYERLAYESLKRGDFKGYLGWLSLFPNVRDENGKHGPSRKNIPNTISKGRMPRDQLTQLLMLYATKGWGGPIPSQAISILAHYVEPEGFITLLRRAITRYGAANEHSPGCEMAQARWRGRAVAALARRNRPDLAFHVFNQQYASIVRYDEDAVAALYRSAKRNNSPLLATIRLLIASTVRERIRVDQSKDRYPALSNTMLTQHGFRARKYGFARRHRKLRRKLRQMTLVYLQGLKNYLVSKDRHGLHPKAVAYFFFGISRMYAKSIKAARKPSHLTHTPLLLTYYQRVRRLGDEDEKTFWATVEMELMWLENDYDAVVQYFQKSFNLVASPSFLTSSSPESYWTRRLSFPPRRKGNVVSERLYPSSSTLLTLWQAAVAMAITPLPRARRSPEEASLPNSQVPIDPIHLMDLFTDFLHVYDTSISLQRTFFSNPFTNSRFFELFLKGFARIEPRHCAWVIHAAQERQVRLDHRIWAGYAKIMVDTGDAGFMQRMFETLEKDLAVTIDFRPSVLKDMSNIGKADEPMMQKIFNAYVYGFGLLLKRDALDEARELHLRIIKAGYREGDSVSLDRLVSKMLTKMRMLAKRTRLD